MGWHIAPWVVGLAGLSGWIVFAWPIWRAILHTRYVADAAALAARQPEAPVPTVAVIVPACNEEAAIERCLTSLLRQTYPALRIVAVNDRSSDRTGEIMDRVAARDERIVVQHIETLPTGWLGKNHANHVGAAATDADWLLFTDGDILFEPNALACAIAFAEAERLDHLCLLPGLIGGGYWESATCCFFGVFFCAIFKTWHVRNPLRQDSFCGVGAFNLVRRHTYQSIGGHVPLRMEVGDDVKLGKLIKHAGFVSDILAGQPSVQVRWQFGLGGVIRGLEKNAFCGADYRVGRALKGIGLLAMLALLPAIGALFAPGYSRLPYLLWLAAQMATLGLATQHSRFSWTLGLGFPVSAAAVAFAAARSMVLALWRGGIIWRGTLYPLDELRKGLV